MTAPLPTSEKVSCETPDEPDHIFELAFSFRSARALMSAVELDVFSLLSDGPVELAALTERAKIQRRGAREFFDLLVALGLLRRDQLGRYQNACHCERYLSRQSPDYVGDLIDHLNSRMYGMWGRLTAALRTGVPQSGALGDGGYDALYADPAAFGKFLRAMTAGSLLPAKALARLFNWGKYSTFVDIGTAQGCVAAEIAEAHPHLTGSGFDLPEVYESFHKYVNGRGLGGRLTFHSGNFFQNELPRSEVLVMGRILHNWGLAAKKTLLEKAYRALPSGGALIVYEPMIDDDRTNPQALLGGLTMLLETQEGSEFTVSQCHHWMSLTGFCDIDAMRLDASHTAVVGYKPG
jgi:O-methyltransferase domain/Dimerisation domain